MQENTAQDKNTILPPATRARTRPYTAKRQQPLGITPVYDRLLRGDAAMPIGLYHLHLATAEQLCRLHYSKGSLTTIKARLLALSDHGFVQSDAIPTKHGRSPYYYTLGQAGVDYLSAAGLESTGFRASKAVGKHALFIEHTLEINDILIAAALLHRVAPAYRLDSFIHERELKRRPYKARGQGEHCTLIPDAFLDIRRSLPDGTAVRLPVLVEHDRGSEEQRYFRRRIRAYVTVLKSGAYHDWFGVKSLTIAFTTFAGEKRREQMRAWTRQELKESGTMAYAPAFLFTSSCRPPDPYQLWLHPCWYTPDSDQPSSLLAGG